MNFSHWMSSPNPDTNTGSLQRSPAGCKEFWHSAGKRDCRRLHGRQEHAYAALSVLKWSRGGAPARHSTTQARDGPNQQRATGFTTFGNNNKKPAKQQTTNNTVFSDKQHPFYSMGRSGGGFRRFQGTHTEH